MKDVAPHGACVGMPETDSNGMPRTPGEPTPQQVLEKMNPCEPYIVSDLAGEFPDASRWTVQRRLDSLVEDDELSKKKHTENRVSYWISR